MNEEELSELQEELAGARVELEQLQARVADREARAAHVEEQLIATREELAALQSSAEAREHELAGERERALGLEQQLRDGAHRYRTLALEHAPELPEELVSGDTIDDIDHAIMRARETVSRVRGHLESQAQAARVPAGAPARSTPDHASLSPSDKIALGLRQRRGE
jgi:hypothetical protein